MLLGCLRFFRFSCRALGFEGVGFLFRVLEL